MGRYGEHGRAGARGEFKNHPVDLRVPRWGGFQIWKAGKPERPDFFLFSRFQNSKQDTVPDAAGLTVPGVLAI
jgi:hypothetical protein